MTANMYKIGDYVYFEISSTTPYQIRRIEELNKTPNGNVEAKVMCFYRRRDISPTLLRLADRHQRNQEASCSKLSVSSSNENSVADLETKTDDNKLFAEINEDNKIKNKSSTNLPTNLTNGEVAEEEVSSEIRNGMDLSDSKAADSAATTSVLSSTTEKSDKLTSESCEKDIKIENGVGAAVESSNNNIIADSNDSDSTMTNGNNDLASSSGRLSSSGGPTVGLIGMESLTEEERHRLRHRELFLSRQIETLPATHIRGKCSVTLLNEMETPETYLEKDDVFFYSLVYEPQQKTLLADKGEIRMGDRFQAVVPLLLPDEEKENHRKDEKLETLVFHPYHSLSDRQLDQFLIIARSVGTFARALDSSSSAKQPSLHMNAAAASRDITLFHALSLLHQANYELGKAVCFLVPPPSKSHYPLEVDRTTGHRTCTLGGPLLCRDQLEEWSAAEAVLFEEALEKYGKDFNDIKQDFLPWKSLRDIVEYYYMWKTTDRYIHQKRIKAVEAESRLKQVYIPSYNKPNPAALNPGNPPGVIVNSSRPCESCGVTKSIQWYTWGPAQCHYRLCSDCWNYWKKSGGIKKSHKMENYDKSFGKMDEANQVSIVTLPDGVTEFRCTECKKGFDRPERLQQHVLTTHPPVNCGVSNCGKEFRGQQSLIRHLFQDHGIVTAAAAQGISDISLVRGGPKTRTAFYLFTTLLTRIARRLSPRSLLNPRRNARNPFLIINPQAIKMHCQTRQVEELRRVGTFICERFPTLRSQLAKLPTNRHQHYFSTQQDNRATPSPQAISVATPMASNVVVDNMPTTAPVRLAGTMPAQVANLSTSTGNPRKRAQPNGLELITTSGSSHSIAAPPDAKRPHRIIQNHNPSISKNEKPQRGAAAYLSWATTADDRYFLADKSTNHLQMSDVAD